MILNTYDDTAGYVDSETIQSVMFNSTFSNLLSHLQSFKPCLDVFLGIEVGPMELKQTYIRSQSFR